MLQSIKGWLGTNCAQSIVTGTRENDQCHFSDMHCFSSKMSLDLFGTSFDKIENAWPDSGAKYSTHQFVMAQRRW
jgi:hypothetical protein